MADDPQNQQNGQPKPKRKRKAKPRKPKSTNSSGRPMGQPPMRVGVFFRYPELRRLFLKHLARYGNLTAAAAYVRLSLEQIWEWRKRCPDFAAEVDRAQEEHKASIELAIRERAIDGWEEPRFGQGGLVGTVRRFSDTLLLAYARRHIPEYRQGDTQQVSGTVKHEHEHQLVDLRQLTEEQRAALRLLLGEHEPEQIKPAQITVEVGSNGHSKNGTT